MDFSAFFNALSDYLSRTPVYTPILAFVAVLLVYVINREYFWKVPKIACALVIAATAYEIFTKTSGGNVFDSIKTYFSNTDYSFGFYYIYLPLFVYSIIFSIIFSVIDKIRSKIEVRMNKLPR